MEMDIHLGMEWEGKDLRRQGYGPNVVSSTVGGLGCQQRCPAESAGYHVDVTSLN